MDLTSDAFRDEVEAILADTGLAPELLPVTVPEVRRLLCRLHHPRKGRRFRVVGHASPGPTPPQITLTGKPHRERRAYPLIDTVDDFSR